MARVAETVSERGVEAELNPATATQGCISMGRNRTVRDDLDEFLEREIFALTVMGGLGHNPTYRKNVGADEKQAFRECLRRCLSSRLEEYQAKPVCEGRHVANIEALSATLSERHPEILLDGKIRIGTAQKALNLYLKYAWARKIIPEPPHCPLDSNVLAKIEKCPRSAQCQICRKKTWTKICTTHQYLHFVEKAREAANAHGQSLACWELDVWKAATSPA